MPNTAQSLPLPSPENREEIASKLSELIAAIEAHPAWTPPQPHKGLYRIWDFTQRTKYVVEELYNIRDGRPILHPEQIPNQKSSE